MNAEKILIDTSVWIDYFKNKSSGVSEKVDKILSENEVYVPKIVLAELIQGAKSEREITVIKDFIDAFHIIDQKEDSWIKAGQFSYNLKKRGKSVNLIDCYISVIAQEYNCKIFTLDERFKEIQRIADINLVL
jgi:tRNA(fMet)-specific endonuclease VapC